MNANHTKFSTLKALAIVALLGISSGAHALCRNTDGSLDDPSMDTSAGDLNMLPTCEAQPTKPAPSAQVSTQAQVSQPSTTTSSSPAATPATPVVNTPSKRQKPVLNAKRPDHSTSLINDCRTLSGESAMGYLGAVEMLTACGA
jgi:hypothetical protein